MNLVVYGADMFGHESGLGQVGGALEPYGEGVEPGPVGTCLPAILDAVLAEPLCDGGDHRGVEPAGEQHAVGHVRHQLTPHGVFQCLANGIDACLAVLYSLIVEPVSPVVALHARLPAPVIMSGREGFVSFALPFERLQFRGHIHGSAAVIAYIERYHSDGVAGYQEGILLFVVKGEGKDAGDVLQEVDAFVAIERKDDFAVAARLEVVTSGILAANLLMIVNLAVDGQHHLPVGREQRLSAALRVDDRETFVSKDGRAATINAAPVRTTVPDFLAHAQSLLAKLVRLLLDVED